MSSTENRSLTETGTTAITDAANIVKAARKARGYSIEDLAVTCGLASSEIARIESGDDADPGKLRRIALSLGVPETTLLKP